MTFTISMFWMGFGAGVAATVVVFLALAMWLPDDAK